MGQRQRIEQVDQRAGQAHQRLVHARHVAGKRDLDRDVNRLDAADAGRVNGKRLERHHDTCQSNALY